MMPRPPHSERVTIFSSLFKITLLLLILSFGVSHRVFGQESTATIVGLVTETAGGVIPNATVRIKT
jgi:hypothetical protein